MGSKNSQRIILLIGIFLFSSFLHGQVKPIPEPFSPPRLVNDYINLLSQQEYLSLERKLVSYNDTTSTQIAIVLEESTGGEDVFTYAQRLAETWGIGQQQEDNGVLILVTTKDRQLRIHPGYGAEIFLTDAMSRRIIDQVLVPNFRNGNYYEGLDRATDIIMQLGTGEYQAKNSDNDEFPIELLIVLFIIILVIISIIKNRDRWDGGDDGGYYRGGRYEHYGPRRRRGGWIISPGSGGFGGSSGGGFGGFGGGSFGGGGASGSW